jgi:hypothetical protein
MDNVCSLVAISACNEVLWMKKRLTKLKEVALRRDTGSQVSRDIVYVQTAFDHMLFYTFPV